MSEFGATEIRKSTNENEQFQGNLETSRTSLKPRDCISKNCISWKKYYILLQYNTRQYNSLFRSNSFKMRTCIAILITIVHKKVKMTCKNYLLYVKYI